MQIKFSHYLSENTCIIVILSHQWFFSPYRLKNQDNKPKIKHTKIQMITRELDDGGKRGKTMPRWRSSLLHISANHHTIQYPKNSPENFQLPKEILAPQESIFSLEYLKDQKYTQYEKRLVAHEKEKRRIIKKIPRIPEIIRDIPKKIFRRKISVLEIWQYYQNQILDYNLHIL